MGFFDMFKSNNAPSFTKAEDILPKLIKQDMDHGLIKDSAEPVKELALEAGDVTHAIFDAIKEFYLNEAKAGRMSEDKVSYSIYHTTMAWSALAGIGAMALWNVDRSKLMSKGIVESLTEERGIFAMDEFVLDMVTNGFESNESNDIIGRLEMQIQPMIHELATTFTAKGVDANTRSHQFINDCIALYLYGIVLQSDRLHEDGGVYNSARVDDFSGNVSLDDMTDEERFGLAWLKIAGQKDMDEGLAIMHKLGDEGFDEGYLALAMFTRSQNDRKAFLEKAAAMGNSEAKWQYSGFIPHSHAANKRNKNDTEWIKYCIDAAEGGCVDAMNELGNIFNRQSNFAESMYWYAMANYYGYSQGMMGMTGIARKWKAAGMPRVHIKGSSNFDENRFKCAITFLELYSDVAPTYNVKDMFGLALDGTALAAYLAGDIYENQGMFEMAYKVFNVISFEHDPHGMKCYADMLMIGRGTSQRPADAFKIYEKAANAGDRESMFTMGEYYRNNDKRELAACWYGKAYARGYEPATARLLELVD